MNDQKLLALPKEKFNQSVKEVFTLHREGDILGLSNSPLAQSSLTAPCFVQDDPTPAVRGQAMGSVLRWVVDTLRPSGEPHWTKFAWRSHNVLDGFYIQQQKTIAELAELMGIANQTFFQSRDRAIKAVGERLRAELLTPQAAQQRQHYAFADRYAFLSLNEQLILRIAGMFQHSMPRKLLHQLARDAKGSQIQESISNLVMDGLLRSDEQQTVFSAPPQMQTYLLTLPSPEERQAWQQAAGEHHEQQQAYLEAAHHFRQAGAYESAAQILITHHQQIISNNQVAKLRDLLEQFQPAELSNESWAQLNIVAGQAAEFMGDSEQALQKYGKALAAKNLRTKANAYYLRAKVFGPINIDEALAHYNMGIDLLQQSSSPERLLIGQMYVHRAWTFIQQRQDLDAAATDLTHAQALIDRGDLAEWADLHNAWGGLFWRKKEYQSALEHRLKAWLAANELQDLERRIKIAHNLGINYSRLGNYERALEYLEKSKALAIQAGNRNAEASCNEHIGSCHFYLGQYEQARPYYELAYQAYVTSGSHNWQAQACYNLTELHAQLGNRAQAQQYFEQGLALAKELKNERVRRDFGQLAHQMTQHYVKLGERKQAQRYFDEAVALAEEFADKRLRGQLEELRNDMSLNERQQKGLAYVKEHGQITNSKYKDLTGLKARQALRDLNEMLEKGAFKKVGKGRSTRYVLP
ncbi:MAG: tetratricopeptide repeat protein [Ardenticatenaceae bacterium]